MTTSRSLHDDPRLTNRSTEKIDPSEKKIQHRETFHPSWRHFAHSGDIWDILETFCTLPRHLHNFRDTLVRHCAHIRDILPIFCIIPRHFTHFRDISHNSETFSTLPKTFSTLPKYFLTFRGYKGVFLVILYGVGLYNWLLNVNI